MMRQHTVTLAALISLASLFPHEAARADTPGADTDAREARACDDRGKQRLQHGHYLDAAAEFQRGYALTRDPRFLLEMAQVYETLGDLPRARIYYDRFLSEAPEHDPGRAKAGDALRALAPAPLSQHPPAVAADERDEGRTQEEIRAILGDADYAEYRASGLTLTGFRQRRHAHDFVLLGGATTLVALGVGLALVLTSPNASDTRAMAGYLVMVAGSPVGLWMTYYGVRLSSQASRMVRLPRELGGDFEPHGGVLVGFTARF